MNSTNLHQFRIKHKTVNGRYQQINSHLCLKKLIIHFKIKENLDLNRKTKSEDPKKMSEKILNKGLRNNGNVYSCKTVNSINF